MRNDQKIEIVSEENIAIQGVKIIFLKQNLCHDQARLMVNKSLALIDLTDYSLLPNGLVLVQTLTQVVIRSKVNKKQLCVGEYWNITFICTKTC